MICPFSCALLLADKKLVIKKLVVNTDTEHFCPLTDLQLKAQPLSTSLYTCWRENLPKKSSPNYLRSENPPNRSSLSLCHFSAFRANASAAFGFHDLLMALSLSACPGTVLPEILCLLVGNSSCVVPKPADCKPRDGSHVPGLPFLQEDGQQPWTDLRSSDFDVFFLSKLCPLKLKLKLSFILQFH